MYVVTEEKFPTKSTIMKDCDYLKFVLYIKVGFKIIIKDSSPSWKFKRKSNSSSTKIAKLILSESESKI